MTPQEVEHTAELLTGLAGAHSVVVVEHDMEFVRKIARRVTVLHQGSVLAEGTMDEVQHNPKVRRSVPGRGSMIEIAGLNQFYGGSHILWDIDACPIPHGSCTVLMGRNGMGKTTLLRCLMGLTPIAGGSIRYGEDRTCRPRPPRGAPAPASASCRRAARSSRSSPWRRTCAPAWPRARWSRAAFPKRSTSCSRC